MTLRDAVKRDLKKDDIGLLGMLRDMEINLSLQLINGLPGLLYECK